MPRERGKFDRLRRMDKFARGVSFTFNEQKKFPTPFGGLITVIILVAVVAWFSSQILVALGDNYVVSSTMGTVELNSDGVYPTYEVTPDQMIIATKIQFVEGYHGDESIYEYFTPVFL